ncbi:glycosyl hydrolase family 2 [Alloacidobacterium dinghuense]|uniref:Glycosyl hydrolase family 2 n=1 Tax=Alloacidobacterium dinghuense TaxID=2763107 RepID=A0A7G8BI86_9BACT|nr:sugar-binding domain-containing protein [Alloacidobacterium dinghuense]QNI32256.1 glycosyl hydrolase family 2 [Alloacidobacterium dinghuense]
MLKRLAISCAVVLMLGTMVPLACAAVSPSMVLAEGWRLQSACKVQASGETISTMTYHPEGWNQTTVPATVLAAQVAAGIYKDPYHGTNLRDIPGTSYPLGNNFSNLPMPDDSPYRCGWWYRREFVIPALEKGRTLWLRFKGINYRADIWVNGKRIADSSQVAGAYRTYEFDVTDNVVIGKPNVVAVETFAPTEKDLGINWVDWNPCPPDKDMGIWGAVDLVTRGSVVLRSPMAVTHFTDASLKQANLTVYAELHNASDKPASGIVSGTVAGIRIEQQVNLAPHEDKTVVFDPETYTQLKLNNPNVWWPYQMGTPYLEALTLRFTAGGEVSDEQSVRFGIREITSELTDKGYRLFRVNGKPILIRGAGWSQDMLLREDPKRLREQFMLVRDMHLNTIRLEGKLETDDFFQLADEQGILVMLGWCCCDQWEHWKNWTPENYEVAKASLQAQILRIRHHASLLVWLNGSDNPPPADVEQMYLDVEARMHWPNPILSSASARPTTVSGRSGVKMSGPYDYVAPSYWYVDTDKHGGGYGFNTETSPGPAIPNISSLRKFIPEDQMWPATSASWSLHNGGGKFKTLTVFDDAMKATYNPPDDLNAYVRVAQAMTYNGERAMFEAYSRNKYTSTGVIQWMLNNAWPSNIWHLYDYYLDAGGGYYGTKKACEPLHVQYSYDDHSIVVVNGTYQQSPRLSVTAKVYDFNLKELFSKESDITIDADAVQKAISIPDDVFTGSSKVFFVDLALKNDVGEILSRNFYWVPSSLTTFDWSKTDYTHTPAIQHEDMTELISLPKAKVEARLTNAEDGKTLQIRLHNDSKVLAFQVAVAARDVHDEDIVPVVWSDDYVELMPGESRVLTAKLPSHALENATIVVSGWNIPDLRLHLSTAKTVATAGISAR